MATVNNRVKTFELTKSQAATLRKEIDVILHSLINKAVSMITAKQETLGGKLRKFAFKTFIDPEKIHTQVPVFSQQIITEIERPSSTKRLKSLAQAS